MSEKIIVSIDPDLEDLIPGFLARREADVTLLRAAIERGDFDAVRLTGHSLKGNGGGYGFMEISDLGAKIEDAARNLDGARALQLVQESSCLREA